MRKILFFAALLTLSSCAVSVKNVELQRRSYDVVDLNVTQTKEIGDFLALKGQEDYQDALMITSRVPDFSVGTIRFPYTYGTVLPLSGQLEKYDLYFIPKDRVAVTGQYSGFYHHGVAIEKSTGKVLPFYNSKTGSIGGFYPKEVEGFTIEKTTYVNPDCQNCFKQEFIFNGKVGNNLKFIYREYINDMARPAFNQDLQYDLEESTTVGFKGLRLEVLDASNTSITYKLLSSFN